MCNAYRLRTPPDIFRTAFPGLTFPGGAPNLEPRDDIRITETAPVIRRVGQGGEAALELTQLRWSWPGPGGKPVYNFRSDGRRFPQGRCLVPADGFYEFTDPEPPAPKRGRKAKWMFALAGEPFFCIAGVMREQPDGTAAFSLLTAPPGPDIAPYHDRQVVVLGPDAWATWLEDDEPERVLRPAPAGALTVERVA